MKKLKLLLYPFALQYGWVMAVRNLLYDRGIFKSEKFSHPIINVGNLTVGGTGKTPHVEYLLRLLKDRKTAILSRGYKRNTKGFMLAGATASAATIGDEPYQYYLDFPQTAVAVCEKRVEGIRQLLHRKPDTDIIILDDAFQHRAVVPTLNLLITDFYRRFDTDFVMPAGLLRESRHGAGRADALIVSKCHEQLQESEKKAIEKSVKRYLKPEAPVFFTAYAYSAAVGFGCAKEPAKNVLLVTAIANAKPLKAYLQQAGYNLLEHLTWPDHHLYTQADVETIQRKWQQKKPGAVSIFTTRKDAVKLNQPAFASIIKELPIFYLPIQVKFLEKEEEFKNLVKAAIAPGKPL